MIDNTFYAGYEGETEVAIVSGDSKLIIWNGYFETILDNLLDNDVEKEGVLEAYFNHDGWYDDSPYLIEDVQLTINQLDCFEEDKIASVEMKGNLGKLIKIIIAFLQKHISTDIYIEYD